MSRLRSVHTTLRGRAVPTTILQLASSSPSSSNPLLVFLPGNPGFIDYYITYLTLIHQSFPHYEILGISHAGFSSLDGASDTVFTLEEQIDHKVQLIRDNTDRPVYIMGHSVGCYILQRAVDALPDLDWQFYGMLMPTVVDINLSKKGIVLSGVTSRFGGFASMVSLLSHITRYIPLQWRRSVLRRFLVGADEHAVDCTGLLVTDAGFIKQALGLATEEMATIQDLWSYQDHWFQKGKTVCVFVEEDHWVSDRTRDRLVAVLERNDAAVTLTADHTHSFCIGKSPEFASLTVEKLLLI